MKDRSTIKPVELLIRGLVRAAYALHRPTATYAVVIQELRGRRK